MPSARTGFCSLLTALALVATIPAGAQPLPGNAALGYRLAEAHCRGCHVIERGRSGGWTDAPSFPDIADRPATNTAWLMGIITRPHMNMLYLPQAQPDAAALTAYIMSLRRH
jgi:mono/diheme cytochrome c family protein